MLDVLIESFDKSRHTRSQFACGQPLLDEFLRTQVSQYEKRRLGKTFVAVRPPEHRVLGYYTLAASAVEFAHLPDELAKKLPRHPVPVVLLARLAVDQSAQRRGVGEMLLMDALARSLQLSETLGVHAVEVLAIDDSAARFYKKYGFVPLTDDVRHLFLPIVTIAGTAK